MHFHLTLLIIALIFLVFTTIRPFKIGKLPLNMATGSLFVLLTLALFQIIDIETLKLGIFGNGQLKPWEIIIIFFTVAYVSISVDVTGILDFFAYKIVHKAKGNGLKLFLFFYLFACVLTVFTSNDIVILTLTPIIFYLGKHAKINILPLLFAEFFGANTLSMLLYIGNPTNIIVGNALGLGFLEYTQVMWLPTLVAATANLLLLYIVFRKKITKKFQANPQSNYQIRNWYDAIISLVLLMIMLGTLILSQTFQLQIWQVTTLFAALFIIEDLAFSFYYHYKYKKLPISASQQDKLTIFNLYGIPEFKNDFWLAAQRVPWKILPFITVFFILIAALVQAGIIDQLAANIASLSTSPGSTIATNGIFSFLLANIINNQPMTILMSSVLVSESFQLAANNFKAAAYSVIIASNLGANLTLIGALAGLMWQKILKNKGVKINYLAFFKVGLIITPIVFCLTLVTLYFSF